MRIDKYASMLLIFVGISGCFSVLFGAWLAHGGQSLPLLSQQRLDTALQYQFIHTLAVFLGVIFYRITGNKVAFYAGVFFMFGVILFSGSLYIKTFSNITVITKLAPLGGLIFAFAWLLLAYSSKGLFNKHVGKGSE